MRISELMTDNHHSCDDIFANLEQLVQQDDWDKTSQEAENFINSMERHFGVEEEILFPAFENTTGMTMGPTQIMRMEHIQLRGLFGELQEHVSRKSSEEVLSVTETILMMMQQHNAKEEGILYPMLDQALGEATDPMIDGVST